MSILMQRLAGTSLSMLCMACIIIVLAIDGISTALVLALTIGVPLGIICCFGFYQDTRKAVSQITLGRGGGGLIAASVLFAVAIPGITRILGVPYNFIGFTICLLGMTGVVFCFWFGWIFQPLYRNSAQTPDFLEKRTNSGKEADWYSARERLHQENAEWNRQRKKK
jgi:hypothetical protein